MQNQNRSNPMAIGLTLLSAVGRILPHAPNMTPLGASCLFAGSRVKSALAYIIPLVAMLITDPFLSHGLSRFESPASFFAGYTKGSFIIYAAFMLNVFIGRQLVKKITPIRVGGAAFLCSLQFFLITNFATWAFSSMYPHNFSGLVTCYGAAVPFWGRTLAGDLVYSAAIFGAYSLATRYANRTSAVAA